MVVSFATPTKSIGRNGFEDAVLDRTETRQVFPTEAASIL